MRPITEALMHANSKNLTQKGWKPDEQRRCFKRADALLDYIAKIKPTEYVRKNWYVALTPQRIEGLKYCLEKDMPSKTMQGRSLEVLKTLLSMGEEMLIRAAWLYRNYPALFKAKYALSAQAFQKDAYFYFMGGRVVPENAFPPFKKGDNPAVIRNDSFLEKCIAMYNDPIFETSMYQEYSAQPIGKKYPFIQWVHKKKAGKRFWGEKQALSCTIDQLHLLNSVENRLNQNLALIKRKQKTN